MEETADEKLQRVLRDPEAVEALDLRDASALPESFGTLVNLKRLRLWRPRFAELPKSFSKLKRLEVLDMSATGTEGFPEEIGDLESLTTLEIKQSGHARVTSVPATIGRLQQLKKLSLHGTALAEFPAAVCELVNLEQLAISGGRAGALPPALGRLKRLTELDLTSAGVESMPAELGDLPVLASLTVTQAPLAELPAQIRQLEHLHSLTLSSCAFEAFPVAIGELKKLSTLILDGNRKLGTIPDGVFTRLSELRYLDLSGCGLHDLPRELTAGLSSLRDLILSDNTFTAEAFERVQRMDRSKLQIAMPRRQVGAPPIQPSAAPLSAQIRSELARLGATPRSDAELPETHVVGQRSWAVPPAMRELLWGYSYPKEPRIGSLDRAQTEVILAPRAAPLDEYEVVHHQALVNFGHTASFDLLLVSLTDDNPADPHVYYLDHEEYGAVEASKVAKMSAFLQGLEARPDSEHP